MAVVGTSRVDESQVRHWATILAHANHTATGGRGAQEEALRFLIRANWIICGARQLGVNVSKQQVNNRLNLLTFEQTHGAPPEFLPREAALRRLLLAQNTAPSEREWLMRLNLLTMKIEEKWLAAAALQVPHTEVASYYAGHKSQFVEPAVSNIEIIGNFDEAKVLKAKREIEAGKSFLEVARYASEDSEAPHGLQRLVRGAEEPPFEKHIFGAKLHVLNGPFRQAISYIFTVLHAKPDRQLTLAESEAVISRRLAPRRVASQYWPAFEAKWIAKTKCQAKRVVRGCREYRQ